MPSPQALTAEALIHGMIACRANAHELIEDADILAGKGRHARAYALLHTGCEEIGKFAVLEIGAKGVFRGKPPEWKQFWKRFRSHDSKSAQLEVQLLMLAVSSRETDDLTGLANTLFSRGLHVRNGTLYADLGPDGKFRMPSDIDFEVPLPGIRALTAHALATTYQRGATPTEIEAHLKAAPTRDTIQAVDELLVRVLERMRDAGFEKEKVLEIINKRFK